MKSKSFVGIIVGVFMMLSGIFVVSMANERMDSWTFYWSSNQDEVRLMKYLGILLIVFGVVDILVSIIKLASEPQNNTHISNISTNYNRVSQNLNSMFVVCEKCGEENGRNNTHCFKCGASLRKLEKREKLGDNNWKCSA